MKLSWFGRLALALFASLALGLGMSACGTGTIAYIWVAGTQYNEIAAFKVDDYTGNLTQAPHEPFNSEGANPIMLLVKSGGRYLYVLNQGSSDTSTSNSADAGIAVFAIGGDGSLTYLESYHSQGFQPMWMQFDSTNDYLYVLDKYSPDYPTTGNGSVTVFSIDGTTGRLTLVLNTQSVPPNSPAPTYWDVGQSPFMMKSADTCLFTVNSADQSITPFSESGSQLVNVTTGKIATSATTISSINGSGSDIVLTDSGANAVMVDSIGSGCTLSPIAGGVVNLASSGTSDPVNSLIATSSTGSYLYVLNQSTTNTTPNVSGSTISGFLIQSTGLSALGGSPYTVDAGPVCMVEDPTNKYMYISDSTAGQITGKIFDPSTGTLAPLSRGSTFSATGLATCLAISGAVD